MKLKLHFRNIRLFNNAGMRMPECYAYARLLDCDKSRLPTTGNETLVTCKHCLALLRKGTR